MLTQLKSLARDEHGFIVSTELVLIATLCVLGLVTALSCVRDAVNGELQDVAGAIGSLNQSYKFTGFHGCVSPQCGVHAWTAGSAFTDLRDEEPATAIEGGPAVQEAPAKVIEAKPAPAPAVIEKLPVVPCPTPAPEVSPQPVPLSAPVTTACPCDAVQPAPVYEHPLAQPNVICPSVPTQPVTICPPQSACPPSVNGGFLVW